MPPPPAPPEPEEDPISDLVEDFIARRLGGERADFGELLARHPEHAERLRQEIVAWEGVIGLLDRLGNGALPAGAATARAEPEPAGDALSEVPLLRETLERILRRTRPFDRYRAHGELGRGGMGAVLRVWDEDLRRYLAMKIALPRSGLGDAHGPPRSDPRQIGRFLEEAQVTAQLDHPGIVSVHELGLSDDGRVYFTMKLVKGRDFHAILELARQGSEGYTITRAVGILLKVCEAMAYAHHKGVMHRDLKPSNVMVGAFGEVFVMDWGLARVLGQAEQTRLAQGPTTPGSGIYSAREGVRESDSDSPLFTVEGTVLGTPAYMPPEQAAGRIEALGFHSDVYAVGAMLYHLLVGHSPHLHGGWLPRQTLLLRILGGPPPAALELDQSVPPELSAICGKAMAHEPSARYASMAELAEDLRAFLEGRVVRAYQVGPWAQLKKWIGRNRLLAGAIALVLLLVFGGSGATSLVLAGKNEDLSAVNAELARQGYEAAIAAADGALRAGDVQSARRYLTRPSPAERGWEWYQLAATSDASERTLYGLSTPARTLALSPDGERILTYGDDERLCVWSLAEGVILSSFELADPGWPHMVALSPSTRLVASTRPGTEGAPRQVEVHAVESGALVASWPIEWSENVPLAFDAGEGALYVGGRVVRRHALTDGALDWERRPTEAAAGLVASPDGRVLALRTQARRLELWRTADGEPLHPDWDGPSSLGLALAFSPEGERIAAATGGGGLQVWEVERGVRLATLATGAGEVWSIAFAPARPELLAGTEEGGLCLFDLREGGAPRTLLGHRLGARALYHPAGERIVSLSHDRTLKLWRLPSRQSPLESQRSTGDFRIFSAADAAIVAIRSGEERLELRDLRAGTTLWTTSWKPESYPRLAFSPDGERIAFPRSGTIELCDAKSGRRLATLASGEAPLFDLAFHPREPVLAALSTDGTMSLWETRGCTRILALPCGASPGRALAFDATGERIAVGSDDGRIRLYSFPQGRLLATLDCLRNPVWDVRFVDEGRHLTALCWKGSFVFDAYLLEPGGRGRIAKHLGAFDAWGRMEVVPHPDGRRFVLSRLLAKSIAIYDARTGTELYALRNQHGQNYGVLAFAGEAGERLLAYDDHGLLLEFDAAPGRKLEREIDALPLARADLARARQGALYLERVLEVLARVPALASERRQAALDLALAECPDRTAFLRELQLALCTFAAPAESLAELADRVERLCELEPEDPTSLCLLALLRYRRGAFVEARDLARSLRESPGEPQACVLGVLALCALERGELEEARQGREALAVWTQAHLLASSSGPQALLAELDRRLAAGGASAEPR